VETLWAPWRMQYILATKAPNDSCVFCSKSQEADDDRNHVLLRDRTCFALLNIYPYSNGHLMVAPYKHTPDFDALTDAELSDLLGVVRRCQHALRLAMQPDGFNIGVNLGKAAGAGIADHLHIHVVPRWNGDNSFMTVLGETRVVPESLDATYARLQEALSRQ
jgi:ATP adenylyltransferase